MNNENSGCVNGCQHDTLEDYYRAHPDHRPKTPKRRLIMSDQPIPGNLTPGLYVVIDAPPGS